MACPLLVEEPADRAGPVGVERPQSALDISVGNPPSRSATDAVQLRPGGPRVLISGGVMVGDHREVGMDGLGHQSLRVPIGPDLSRVSNAGANQNWRWSRTVDSEFVTSRR